MPLVPIAPPPPPAISAMPTRTPIRLQQQMQQQQKKKMQNQAELQDELYLPPLNIGAGHSLIGSSFYFSSRKEGPIGKRPNNNAGDFVEAPVVLLT